MKDKIAERAPPKNNKLTETLSLVLGKTPLNDNSKLLRDCGVQISPVRMSASGDGEQVSTITAIRQTAVLALSGPGLLGFPRCGAWRVAGVGDEKRLDGWREVRVGNGRATTQWVWDERLIDEQRARDERARVLDEEFGRAPDQREDVTIWKWTGATIEGEAGIFWSDFSAVNEVVCRQRRGRGHGVARHDNNHSATSDRSGRVVNRATLCRIGIGHGVLCVDNMIDPISKMFLSR